MKFSYAMLPDYPLEESLRAIKLADELGFYAVLRRRRDLAQGSLAAVRRGGAADLADPHGAEPLGGRPAGADAHRPGGRDARRADRGPGRGGPGQRELRAARRVQDRLGTDQAAVAGHRGGQRGPHAARRGRHHLRRGVLPLRGAVHLRPPGAGAPAGEDGRHARPEVVRRVGRALRRLPPRAELHPRGLRLRGRAPAGRRREGGQGLDDAGLRRVGGRRRRAGLRRRQGRRPQHGRHLRVVHAGRAARAQRGGPGQPQADHRGDRRRATWRAASS